MFLKLIIGWLIDFWVFFFVQVVKGAIWWKMPWFKWLCSAGGSGGAEDRGALQISPPVHLLLKVIKYHFNDGIHRVHIKYENRSASPVTCTWMLFLEIYYIRSSVPFPAIIFWRLKKKISNRRLANCRVSKAGSRMFYPMQCCSLRNLNILYANMFLRTCSESYGRFCDIVESFGGVLYNCRFVIGRRCRLTLVLAACNERVGIPRHIVAMAADERTRPQRRSSAFQFF